MTRRNNLDRVGEVHDRQSDPPPMNNNSEGFNPLSFVAPTEFVELPSKGAFYPEGHPLHQKETIEIRYMTAKDEDILSSRTLLKKGIAIERFMQNIVVDKKINVKDMLVGDRNAIIIAARVSGYGAAYETQIACPQCGAQARQNFDLSKKTVIESVFDIEGLDLTNNEDGTFTTTMPYSKFKICFKLLTGEDEVFMTQSATNKRKKKVSETILTDQYRRMIHSIEGHTGRDIIGKYIDNMPTLDSRHLKACYKAASPDIKIIEDFECSSCGYEQELEVPFGADFFWPDR